MVDAQSEFPEQGEMGKGAIAIPWMTGEAE